MSLLSIQAPSAVVLIRPHRFHPNAETAADNAFQRAPGAHAGGEAALIARAARDKVSAAAQALENAGVRVHLFDHHGEHETPDSLFPNNWFSTHPGGHVALYPMYSPSRRRERRDEVRRRLEESGRAVIALEDWQVGEFAANAIELSGAHGRVLALSGRAAASLTPQQRSVIERSTRLLPLHVPIVELAGGSVRSMIGGIHLARRHAS